MATQQKEQICSIKSKISQIDAGRRKKQQFNQWLDEYTSYLSTLSKSEPQVARKVLEFAELVPRSSKKPYSSKVIIFANTKRHAAREV